MRPQLAIGRLASALATNVRAEDGVGATVSAISDALGYLLGATHGLAALAIRIAVHVIPERAAGAR